MEYNYKEQAGLYPTNVNIKKYKKMKITIRKLTDTIRDIARDIIKKWLADFIITRGRKVYPAEMEGFLAFDEEGKNVGMVTYEIVGDQCEVLTLDAFKPFSGIGTALLKKVEEVARTKKCRRLWLITINSNIDAIRFYQKRGMTLAAVHVNALELSRKLKPVIPLICEYGIPMRDEIEFEIWLE